jgi:hypothetical protein
MVREGAGIIICMSIDQSIAVVFTQDESESETPIKEPVPQNILEDPVKRIYQNIVAFS